MLNARQTTTEAIESPEIKKKSLFDLYRVRGDDRKQARQLLRKLGWQEESVEYSVWDNLLWQALSAVDWKGSRSLRFHDDGTVEYLVLLPNNLATEKWLSRVEAEMLGLEIVSNEQLVESLPDRQIVARKSHLKAESDFGRLVCALYLITKDCEGEIINWGFPDEHVKELCGAFPPRAAQTSKLPPGKKVRMLLSRETDVTAARTALSPWARKWKAKSFLGRFEGPMVKVVRDVEAEVDFEIEKDSPSLDNLRWVLNQTKGLGFAAGSLQYLDRFNGFIVPQQVIDRLQPTKSELKKIQQATPLAKGQRPKGHQSALSS